MRFVCLPVLLAASAFAQSAATAQPPAGSQPAPPAREPGLYAIFNTSMGTITAKLYEKEAPMTVRNFVALARGTKPWRDAGGAMVTKPLYNNITFHRVIPGFMIQSGDPTATGAHNCNVKLLDEILPTLKFDRPGRLAMANIGEPNSGGCQFFLTEAANRGLDPAPGNSGYTIFGQVVEGQEVIGKIARVERDKNDRPRTPVRLISVTIKREGPEPAPASPKKAAKK